MRRAFLLVWLVVGISALAQAEEFSLQNGLNTRAQFGSKVVGLTIIHACPFAEVVQEIQEAGVAMHADYTVLLPVIGQENCPANLAGPVYPSIEQQDLPDGESFHFALGVTVGIHYRDFR